MLVKCKSVWFFLFKLGQTINVKLYLNEPMSAVVGIPLLKKKTVKPLFCFVSLYWYYCLTVFSKSLLSLVYPLVSPFLTLMINQMLPCEYAVSAAAPMLKSVGPILMGKFDWDVLGSTEHGNLSVLAAVIFTFHQLLDSFLVTEPVQGNSTVMGLSSIEA